MNITKDNNEAKYVFSWNAAEIVEVHTEQTFITKYGNLNIKDFCRFKDMNELFDDGLCNEESVNIDNMFVVRL